MVNQTIGFFFKGHSDITPLPPVSEEFSYSSSETIQGSFNSLIAQLLLGLYPLLTISSFRVSPVVVMIDPAFTPTPDPREVADVFQVPLDVLMDPVMLERIELQFAGRARHVFQYRYQPQRIWGVTASILYNLRERLAGVGQGGA